MGPRSKPIHPRDGVKLKLTMSAAYDTYDYPSYWEGRDYEHNSEFIAIKGLLTRIPKIDKIIEIGTGYGRLIPSYSFRAKKIVVSDPSASLLTKARKKYKNIKKIEYIQSGILNIKKSTKPTKFDLVVMVRVLHHINDIDKAFEIIYSLLNKGGYFILEFPNKSHLKASIRNMFKGNLTYPLNIFPIDLRSKKNIKNKTLPFINYHPDQIKEKLVYAGFEIIEIRSVSNIRSTFIKKLFPLNLLLDIEKSIQKPFSRLNFGPSYFVLARKRVI